MLRWSEQTRQEGEAVRFCGLYSDMNGVAMAGAARWIPRCWGRAVVLVPACQFPGSHVLRSERLVGDFGGRCLRDIFVCRGGVCTAPFGF